VFQCSSASRKFLNLFAAPFVIDPSVVSVLFSEPKIPQLHTLLCAPYALRVSVLFSEPKIPQNTQAVRIVAHTGSFSALQRAENSSTLVKNSFSRSVASFQCSSASRKFLNSTSATTSSARWTVSVLFSEPKIPQRH